MNENSFAKQLAVIRPVLSASDLLCMIACNEADLLRDEDRNRLRNAFEIDGRLRELNLPLIVMLVRLVQASDIHAQDKAGTLDADTRNHLVAFMGLEDYLPLRLYYEDRRIPGYRFVSISGQLVVSRPSTSSKSSQTRLRAVHPES